MSLRVTLSRALWCLTLAITTSMHAPAAVSRQWGPVAPVGIDGALDITDPHAAVNASGTITVAWPQQSAGSNQFYTIWANRFVAGQWDGAAPIQTGNTGDAQSVYVATDNNGNAMVLWDQTEDQGKQSQRNTIWWNFYAVNLGRWTGAQRLVTDDTRGFGNPRVAFDARSNAFVALWSAVSGNLDHLFSSRFTTGAWGPITSIDDARGGRSAQIAVNDSGVVTVAWVTETATAIAARRYTPERQWGPVATVRNNKFLDAVRVAVDRFGNAFAFWDERQSNQQGNRITLTDVVWSRFTIGASAADGTWSQAQTMVTGVPATNSSRPGTPIVFTPDGDAFVLRSAPVAVRDFRVRVNHFSKSRNSWDGFTPVGVDEPIDPNVTRFQTSYDLSVDPNGNLLAAWESRRISGVTMLLDGSWYSNRFAGSWSEKTPFDNGSGETVRGFQTLLEADGDGVLVWPQFATDGTMSVWSQRYE